MRNHLLCFQPHSGRHRSNRRDSLFACDFSHLILSLDAMYNLLNILISFANCIEFSIENILNIKT